MGLGILKPSAGCRAVVTAAHPRLSRLALWIALASIFTASARAQNNCDLNGDGVVDVADVVLITGWELTPAQCPPTINVVNPGVCDEGARQVVIKAALGDGCHFVYLSWIASVSPKVVGYNIYRGTTLAAAPSTRLNTVLITTTGYVDTTTQSGVTYYYQVKAYDGTNESPPSNLTQATSL